MSQFDALVEFVGRTKVMVEGNALARVKVKVEGLGKKKSTTSWTQPMYVEPLKLFSMLENRGCLHREFVEKYGLAYLDGGSKSLKEEVDYTEDEMVEFYCPIIRKNNYHYSNCTNKTIFAQIELSWMVH